MHWPKTKKLERKRKRLWPIIIWNQGRTERCFVNDQSIINRPEGEEIHLENPGTGEETPKA